MTYWMYGVGFVAVVIFIGTLKSTFQTRMLCALGLIAFMAFLKMNSRKK